VQRYAREIETGRVIAAMEEMKNVEAALQGCGDRQDVLQEH
jgi:hypothetical protein